MCPLEPEMYLTAEETARVLGVSVNWVRERIDAGDSQISRHLKCRRDTVPSPKADRSPVRISTADLARYIISNTREHGWSPFPDSPIDVSALEALERRIWTYLLWYRSQTSAAAKQPMGQTVPSKTRRRVS